MLTSEEKDKVLFTFNSTNTEYPAAENYCQLFFRQVSLNPDRTAVVFGNKTLNYSELEQRSNQIANYLLSKGTKKGDLIGIYLDRSLEMITGILGILKAGAAYLPVDPEYPAERINFMLGDAGLQLILCNNKTIENSDVLRNNTGRELI